MRLYVHNPNEGMVEGECLGKPVSLWFPCVGTREKEDGEDF